MAACRATGVWKEYIKECKRWDPGRYVRLRNERQLQLQVFPCLPGVFLPKGPKTFPGEITLPIGRRLERNYSTHRAQIRARELIAKAAGRAKKKAKRPHSKSLTSCRCPLLRRSPSQRERACEFERDRPWAKEPCEVERAGPWAKAPYKERI